MAIPAYLQDKISPRKRSKRKIIFNLILIGSLALNVYLLTSPENSNLSLASGNWSIEVAEAEAKTTENPDFSESPDQAIPAQPNGARVETAAEPEVIAENVSPELQITPVSYVIPESQNNTALLTLHLKIHNSLTYSVCKAMTKEQGCQRMSAYLSRLLSWKFDINKSMRKGDSLDIVYEMVPGSTRFRILRLVYNSQLFNEVYEASYFNRENSEWGSYFDAKGQAIAKRVVDQFAPVRNYQEITSLPGDFRKGPVGHKGTDFKTPIGTPVYASFEAKVLRVNWNVRANGYCVELDHPREGVKTLYLHLSHVLVKKGQYVKQGEKIAETGNTGRTFAPHLHFELKSRDQKEIVYNPFNFKHIKTFYKTVSLEEQKSFQKKVNFYDSILQKG
jgi:murein DD-endopeptidase